MLRIRSYVEIKGKKKDELTLYVAFSREHAFRKLRLLREQNFYVDRKINSLTHSVVKLPATFWSDETKST